MYTLKSYIEQKVPAYEECLPCEGTGDLGVHGLDPAPCSACDGSGGTWHPDVRHGTSSVHHDHFITFVGEVTKSSFLVRRWGVCEECDGHGDDASNFFQAPELRPRCSACKGTRAEPGTASEWEVE